MATEFNLPDSPPPGNTFPVMPKGSGQRASVMTLSKGQPRSIVVEVKEEQPSRPSEEHNNAARPATDESTTLTPTPERAARSRPHLMLHIHTTPPPPPPPANPPASHSQASSMTLHDNEDEAAAGPDETEDTDQTPVMRSMFPRYDPAVRMSRQDYVPVTELLPPPPPLRPGMHSSRPTSQISQISQFSNYVPALSSPMLGSSPHLGQQRTMTPAMLSPPLPMPDREQELSSPEDLLDLWTIANGQLCPEAKDTYVMGLECDSLTHDREAMQFTSSCATVYRLHASGNTVVVTRTHPMNEGTELTISTPLVRTPSTTSPLLASIFPCLAELLALDTASNVAIANTLSRQDSASLQAEALQRARTNEAASLLWDSDSLAYFFTVPALANPTAPVPQALTIVIVPGKSIVLQDPARRPLLSLNLHEAALTVHVQAIIELSSSLYTLDLLITTLLTLLLHLHRHTALLTPYAAPVVVPHFEPPPRVAHATSPASPRTPLRAGGVSRASHRSKAASTAGTPRKLNRWLSRSTQPSRNSHHAIEEEELRSPPSAYSSPYVATSPSTKDLEAALSMTTLRPALSSPRPILAANLPALPENGVAPELKREVTGVDLSRFQAYDLSDPELGKSTRFILRVLYWAFGVLVWVLGVAVGVIAACFVGIAGLVGGKKEGRIDGGREG